MRIVHQPETRPDRREIYAPLYRTTCVPDAEAQRAMLEALRYKWRYESSPTLAWRVLQRLGDSGRQYAGWAAAVAYLCYWLSR